MPSSYGGTVVASSAAVAVTSTLCVALRLTIRTHLKTLGTDDYLILAAWTVLTIACVCAGLSTKYGFGQHRDLVGTSDYNMYLKLFAVISPAYSTGIGLAKSSFAVLYTRINPHRGFIMLNRGLVVFLTCQAVEESLIALFKCRPVQASWDINIQGDCLNLVPLWWSTFVFNMITDLIIFIQPIPSVWKLHLPLTKRLGIIFMLSLGLLVCAISVIRIIYVTQIELDDTYEFARPIIWSLVELGALIVCSCIPCLRQVIQQIPWLNQALGLSSNKASGRYDPNSGRPHGSYPLGTYSKKSKGARSGKASLFHASHYRPDHSQLATMTSRAVGGRNDSDEDVCNDSTDEIIPHAKEGIGAIVVTHEVTRDVESNVASASASSMAESVHEPVGYSGRVRN